MDADYRVPVHVECTTEYGITHRKLGSCIEIDIETCNGNYGICTGILYGEHLECVFIFV